MNSLTKLSTPMKALSTPMKTPSTPASQTTPSTPTTGTWQHPRLQEITRRQNASTFSNKNLRAVIYNSASLLGCLVLEKVISSRFPALFSAFDGFHPYTSYIYATIRLIFIVNVLFALSPLVRPQDTLSDIPLTPAQRALLGLPASATPPTPGSTYVTPPRYSRSPATRSVSNSPRPNSPLNHSPLNPSPLNFNASFSGSLNGTPSKPGRESPFSPNNASPLLQKTFINQRRESGGGAGFGQSVFGRMNDPGTPSPSSPKASVALNNKWLFEKGRSGQGAGGRLFRD